MLHYSITPASLVLYKQSPALVTAVADKIEIELGEGKTKRVRPKDVTLIHPGPMNSLAELDQTEADLEEAWELLADEVCDLEELAALIYGEFTPASAWISWQQVASGLFFEGDPAQIRARTKQQIEADIAARQEREQAAREEEAFYHRLQRGELEEQDRTRMAEVERVALGEGTRSRILVRLGHAETPVNAHRALVKAGFWPADRNPHPERLSLPVSDPVGEVPELPNEARRDLTHLKSFAIDDAGSMDPDDAISLQEDRVWVHVADVAALVAPESTIDLEARARAANLYLPERIVHMLPAAITPALGLGLTQRSPALSFGFRLSEDGEPIDLQIVPSWISVERKSYEGANLEMEREPFATLQKYAELYRARRMGQGAIDLDLPEASVKVDETGKVIVKPLKDLASRSMVTELMLMTGEAVAAYALEHDIPLPFVSQPATDVAMENSDLATRFAHRRLLKPSQAKTLEEPHAGLGLACYTRVTSPLRRYLDLVVHQQLRAHLLGLSLLPVATISERIAASSIAGGSIRRAERFSNLHWKLIYLQQNSDWSGEGIVVERQEQRLTLIIPNLAMDVRLRHNGNASLNDRLRLAVRDVDVPDQMAWFRVLS